MNLGFYSLLMPISLLVFISLLVPISLLVFISLLMLISLQLGFHFITSAYFIAVAISCNSLQM